MFEHSTCGISLQSNIGLQEETTLEARTCTEQDQVQYDVYWTNNVHISSVVLNWDAALDLPPQDYGTYVRDVRLGVVDTYAQLEIFNTGNQNHSM